jgi:hypothetical protein
MDVAEHVGDRRAVDADAGRLLDRQDGFDRHAVAGLDDLQRMGGHGRQGGERPRQSDSGTHRPSVPRHREAVRDRAGAVQLPHWVPP